MTANAVCCGGITQLPTRLKPLMNPNEFATPGVLAASVGPASAGLVSWIGHWQVPGDWLQIAECQGRVCLFQALVKLMDAGAALGHGVMQHARHPLPVGVRRAEVSVVGGLWIL